MSVLGTRRRGAGWWIIRLVGAMVVGLVLALAIDVVRLGGIERWFAAHRLPPPYLPIGRTLEIDGAAVYLDCRGAGSPTVVLDSGLGSTYAQEVWAARGLVVHRRDDVVRLVLGLAEIDPAAWPDDPLSHWREERIRR